MIVTANSGSNQTMMLAQTSQVSTLPFVRLDEVTSSTVGKYESREAANRALLLSRKVTIREAIFEFGDEMNDLD